MDLKKSLNTVAKAIGISIIIVMTICVFDCYRFFEVVFHKRIAKAIYSEYLSENRQKDTLTIDIQTIFNKQIDSIIIMREFFGLCLKNHMIPGIDSLNSLNNYKGYTPNDDEIMMFVFFRKKNRYREIFTTYNVRFLVPYEEVLHTSRLQYVLLNKEKPDDLFGY